MRQKSVPVREPATQVLKDIRRATRRHFSAEDKIRIVLEGLRGEDSIAELCRREGIVQNLYYRIQARCYAYEEVFGEKVRALGERARPRDLYDVINLFRNEEFAVAAAAIRDVVQSKCNFKGIPFLSLVGLDPFKEELVGEWKNMLGHQLPALPPIESFLWALPEFFAWLGGQERAAPILAVHPMARNTEVIRGPAGTMGFAVRSPSFIETIRFAAANRMCIDLDYRDEQGRRSTRVIEPYSLRRTQAGDVLLMAVRADSAQARSYRLDRIEGARAMQRTFTPRYPVELTPHGTALNPRQSANSRQHILGRVRRGTCPHTASGPFRSDICLPLHGVRQGIRAQDLRCDVAATQEPWWRELLRPRRNIRSYQILRLALVKYLATTLACLGLTTAIVAARYWWKAS